MFKVFEGKREAPPTSKYEPLRLPVPTLDIQNVLPTIYMPTGPARMTVRCARPGAGTVCADFPFQHGLRVISAMDVPSTPKATHPTHLLGSLSQAAPGPPSGQRESVHPEPEPKDCDPQHDSARLHLQELVAAANNQARSRWVFEIVHSGEGWAARLSISCFSYKCDSSSFKHHVLFLGQVLKSLRWASRRISVLNCCGKRSGLAAWP